MSKEQILSNSKLIEEAVANDEGKLVSNGAFLALTGSRTGRSPKDKHVVRHKDSDKDVWWGSTNHPIDEHTFFLNRQRAIDYLNTRDQIYVFDGFAGWDPNHRIKVRVICARAYHALFMHNMLIRPTREELENFGSPDCVIYNAGQFPANSFTAQMTSRTSVDISLERKEQVILGTEYAGEMKKGVFTLMHWLLPPKGVLSMHCAANQGQSGEVSLFFGLSGTGKTTLSADPSRRLLGDDEHGWSDSGVFNIEGGCYAKTINLSYEDEPQIFSTTEKFSTVIENMNYDPSDRSLKFSDSSITENMRCAYPISYIKNSSKSGYGGVPKNIILLTCDAFGVLPPVAKLTAAEAVFYFLSGFTSKVAGTEEGIKEPVPTFSTCFGAPFMPQKPEVYGKLLWSKIHSTEPVCWLLNTGWSGGSYGEGKRISIELTRKILKFILSNKKDLQARKDQFFNFCVPIEIDGVPKNLLNPRENWANPNDYDRSATKLKSMFVNNFQQFSSINEKVDSVYNRLKND